MKSAFFTLLSSILLLVGCAEPETNNSAGTAEPEVAEVPKEPYYRRYEGTVNGDSVVVHWHQFGGLVYAAFYHQHKGRKIELFNWEDTVKNGKDFYLTERPVTEFGTETDPHWMVSVAGNKLTGKWISGDTIRTAPITLTEAYPAGSYQFGLLYLVDSASLLHDKPEPMARTTYLSVIPQSSFPATTRSFLLPLLSRQFGCKDERADLQTCIAALNKAYFQNYRAEVSQWDTSGLSDPGFSSPTFNYSSDRYIRINYNSNDLLVLEDFMSDYSGGAHGNYASSFLNIDLKAQKVLSLNDIITASDTARLIPILQKQAAAHFRLKTGETLQDYLFESKVPLTGNFYITHTGITFLYNPYEIAAYAVGQVNIFVPYSSIRDLLTPTFRTRLSIQ